MRVTHKSAFYQVKRLALACGAGYRLFAIGHRDDLGGR